MEDPPSLRQNRTLLMAVARTTAKPSAEQESESKCENPGSRAGAVEEAQRWNLGQVRGAHRVTPSNLGSGLPSATRYTVCK